MNEKLIGVMIAAVRTEKDNRFFPRLYEQTYIKESFLGSVWFYLLDGCKMASYDNEAPGNMKLSEVELACRSAGICCKMQDGWLNISMENHSYAFCHEGTGAYGGPHGEDGWTTGGTSLIARSEDFVEFLNSFDALVPEVMEYFDSKIQEARNYVKAEDVMCAAVEVILRQEVKNMDGSYSILVKSCNPEDKTVELWFSKSTEGGTVILKIDYDKLIQSPTEYCEKGIKALRNPEIPDGQDFLLLSFTEE